MDIQMKKGLLEICVLAVLKKNESYGYAIVKSVSECVEISESTLYPILKRLEANGSLATYSQQHNGRLRKYYMITPVGEKKINAFLDEWKDLKSVHEFILDSAKYVAKEEKEHE